MPNQPLKPMGSAGSPQAMQSDADAQLTPATVVAHL
jgi:hypothetical protein